MAVTAYITVPGPLPVAPAVTVIQPREATAVHAQPAGEVTVTLANPPSLPNVPPVGERLAVQLGVGSVGELFFSQLAATITPP